MRKTIPAFGLGTFRLTGKTVIDSVSTALELGYRLVDTAQIYGNETEVGHAIAASPVGRDQLFLTTKIWTENLSRASLRTSLEESLRKLRTDHVDLTLIHWPSPNGGVPLAETLTALKQAKDAGLTRQIGVSNFPIAAMRQSIEILGASEIATNQVELHPYLQNRAVAQFAASQGIPLTSYMTLAYGKALTDPVILDIARQRDATPAQVVLAWALQLGFAVIPSSTKRENLASNLLATRLTLRADDMVRIAALDRGGRLVDPDGLAPVWD